MRNGWCSIALVMTGVLLVAGCATLGPAFQPVDKIQEGMGLIYIYREKKFIAGGVSYDVKVGDTVIMTLHNGGYYPYFVRPGEVEVSASLLKSSSVIVDVKAGEVYYVKGEFVVESWSYAVLPLGPIVHPHLRLVSREKGEQEIKECNLIPAR